MGSTSISISFSTIGELDEAARRVGLGESVVLQFVGSVTLAEVATIHRRLQVLDAASKGLWRVHEGSMSILHRNAAHYEDLDLLELTLELMDLDLKDSVPMKMVRFAGIRETANAVVTTADASNVFHLLDDVVIDSQRLARVCRGLGFGRQDIEVASLSQDDLIWLTKDGAGALVLAGDDGGEVPEDGYGGGEKMLPVLIDGAEELARSVDGSKAFAGLVDVAEALPGSLDVAEALPVLVDSGKALPVLVDGAEVLPGLVDDGKALPGSVGGGNVLPGLLDGKEGALLLADQPGLVDADQPLLLADQPGVVDADQPLLLTDQPLLHDLDAKENVSGGDHGHVDGRGAWVHLKEGTVVALLRFKIRKLKESIVRAKGRMITA